MFAIADKSISIQHLHYKRKSIRQILRHYYSGYCHSRIWK